VKGQRLRKHPSRAEAALRNERVTRGRVAALEAAVAAILSHLGLGLESTPEPVALYEKPAPDEVTGEAV
jgi:hypothetical protein